MKSRSFAESLHYAVSGVLHAFRTQRNVRTHFGLGALVLLLSLTLGLSRLEMAVLVLTIGFVIAAELVNTAIEHVVDLISEQYHVLARHAKNVAAGAVLVAAFTAAFVGYILFFDRLSSLHPEHLRRVVALPSSIILLALVLVVVAVVALKALGPDFRLSGGMPSFHTAVAGALATAIFFLAAHGSVALLGLLLAALVGQARVEGRIHSVVEVVAGGVLGSLITMLVFSALW